MYRLIYFEAVPSSKLHGLMYTLGICNRVDIGSDCVPFDRDYQAVVEDIDICKELRIPISDFVKLLKENRVVGVESYKDLLVVCSLSHKASLLWNTMSYSGKTYLNSVLDVFKNSRGYGSLLTYLSNSHENWIDVINGFGNNWALYKIFGFKDIISCKTLNSLGDPLGNSLRVTRVATNDYGITYWHYNFVDFYINFESLFHIIGNILMFYNPEKRLSKHSPVYTWKLDYKFFVEML